jgi:hypothetical protein
VFALLSWLLFAALLAGRRWRGWRGKTALRFTLAGFATLALAYVGSRFVLEVVLHRGDFSIGIELEGTDFEPFTDLQYAVLARLTDALRLRYPLADIAGHEHIAPGRKTDPGPFFDWARFQKNFYCLAEQAQLRFPAGGSGSQA